MPLFKLSGQGRASELEPSGFKTESELQQFVETNLQALFGLRHIATRPTIRGLIPDTIAYDETTRAPVIIEYKLGGQSATEQGVEYLQLLHDRKADFMLLLQQKLGKELQIEWDNSKVMFIERNYTKRQQSSLSLGLPFELWRYSMYSDIFEIEQLPPPETQIPLARVAKTGKLPKTLKVTGAEGYSVAGHLGKVKDEAARQAFESLRSYMLNLDTRVIETPKKWFIGYSMGKKFAEIVPQAKAFLLYLNLDRSDIDTAPSQVQMDAVQLGFEDVSNVGRWATGNVRVKITNKDQAEQAQSLVEHSFIQNSRLRTPYDRPRHTRRP